MTNREIVALVRTQLKQISGDDIISDRAILAELKSTANLYIKREVDKRRLWNVDSLFTTIECLAMKEVPLAECCSYKSSCTIRRSEKKLPKVGEGIWGYIIQGVFSIDGSTKFTEGTADRYANALDLKLRKLPTFYWLQNGYLYISDSNIEIVRLKAYFEEDIPYDINACDKDTDKACNNPLDNDFKCPGYLIQNVLDTVTQKYAKIFMQTKEDVTDNDSEIN